MRILKKVFSLLLVAVMVISILPMNIINSNAITFDELNASKVFLKQEGKTTCTLCAATMMMRRYSMLRGDSDWYSITESAIKSNAWIDKQGLRYSFSYNNNSVSNINVGHYDLSSNMSEKEAKIQAELKNCPEGIVVYNRNLPHAVLLTDYTDGVYYCADPYSDSSSGRIPLDSSYGVRMSNITDYWKVTSPVVNGPTSAPTSAELSINKNGKMLVNDYITFNFGGNNNNCFTLGIYKNDVRTATYDLYHENSYTVMLTEPGNYKAYMTAYNNDGTYADSNWVYWEVCDITAELTLSSHKVLKNDNITFYLGGNHAGSVENSWTTIGIFKGEEHIDTVDIQGDTYTRSFSEAGKYKAYFTGYGNGKYADSNWVYWEVCNVSAELSLSSYVINTNDSLTFYLSGNHYGSIYNGESTLGIYKDDERIDTVTTLGSTYTCTFTEPGKYKAYFTGYSDGVYADSNWVYWEVTIPYSISHWVGGFEFGEGNNTNKDLFLLNTDIYTVTVGEKIVLDENKIISPVPNGFYPKNIGTSSITGNWERYNFGIEITNPSDNMHFEYYYNPYKYLINYDLNGGTNAESNPSTYNVLYGFTLENPTREGYTFAGWTDANGNIVTGINPGKNANFATNATYEQFCKELAGRTTGDQTLTANWIADSYTITYNANGGINAPATQAKKHDTAVNLSNSIPTRTGYTFLGWATDKNATVAEYLPGAEFNVNAETTLYAVWEKGCPGEHNYNTTVTDPTCSANGYTEYVCADCEHTYRDSYKDALGHRTDIINSAPADCENDGYTGDVFCTRCNTVIESGEIIEKMGHSYITSVLKAPTATTKGAYDATCEICGDYVTATLPFLSDTDFTVTEEQTPDCTEEGFVIYTLKDVTLGEVKIEVKTESKGHVYNKTVTDPTCTAGGYTEYVCADCGDSYIDNRTDALGHSFVDGICTVCGESAPVIGGDNSVGDLNGDGGINASDSNIMKRILSGVITADDEMIVCADIDKNGAINGIDSNLMSKIISGMN